VLIRESTFPRSSLARAVGETIALSASSCCDQPSNARAALIWRAVTMREHGQREARHATQRPIIGLKTPEIVLWWSCSEDGGIVAKKQSYPFRWETFTGTRQRECPASLSFLSTLSGMIAAMFQKSVRTFGVRN
jgi:hypothetical protein